MSQVSRRRFFAHSAHKAVGVSAGLAAFRAGRPAPGFAAGDDTRAPVKLCLVSGSLEYKSDESLARLEEYLEGRYPVKCSRAFRRATDDLPGLENLEQSD